MELGVPTLGALTPPTVWVQAGSSGYIFRGRRASLGPDPERRFGGPAQKAEHLLISGACCWTPSVTVCLGPALQDGLPALEMSSWSCARRTPLGAICRCHRSECPGCAARSG